MENEILSAPPTRLSKLDNSVEWAALVCAEVASETDGTNIIAVSFCCKVQGLAPLQSMLLFILKLLELDDCIYNSLRLFSTVKVSGEKGQGFFQITGIGSELVHPVVNRTVELSLFSSDNWAHFKSGYHHGARGNGKRVL